MLHDFGMVLAGLYFAALGLLILSIVLGLIGLVLK